MEKRKRLFEYFLVGFVSSVETFRFENKNDYEYEIWPKGFLTESFIVQLIHQKVSTVMFFEWG